jgi:anti-sigma factor RsiW
MATSDQCPADPEGTAEAYLLDTLPPDEARAFRDHYPVCPRCMTILEDTVEYVHALREAAQRIRDSEK